MLHTSDASAIVEFGRFRVEPHRRELLADDQPIKLGGRAFDLLRLSLLLRLLQRPDWPCAGRWGAAAVKALAWNTYFWKMLEGCLQRCCALPVKLQKSGIPWNVLYNGGSCFTPPTRRRSSSSAVS